MTILIYRRAVPEDAFGCISIRGRTRENAFSPEQLEVIGITPETWADGIMNGNYLGYVCCAGNGMVGYCFGDRDSGEIGVLALLPDYESRGIGKSLLNLVVEDFRAMGYKRLHLGCAKDPATRSHDYRVDGDVVVPIKSRIFHMAYMFRAVLCSLVIVALYGLVTRSVWKQKH